MAKCFAKCNKIKQNWRNLENFDICFCVSFDRYCQNIMCGGETGH